MASSSSSSSSKTMSLKTADGDVFEVEASIANKMQTVQTFIDVDDAADAVLIPLPNVYTREFVRIIEYCKQHYTGAGAGNTKAFDEEFTKPLSDDELMDLVVAANYLNMAELLDFLSDRAADRIKDKSVKAARRFFRVTDSGYTPAEERKLREENAWAFKGVPGED